MTTMSCPLDSDNHFGPQLNPNCRSFDFTLLFEDAFFAVLPAACFLLLLPPRLHFLRRTPVKLKSYRLAIVKLSLLAVLFVLHVLFTAFQVRTSALHTRLSMSSGILNIMATFAALFLSFMEDQRSVEPSDVLVIYFSALSILALPRLRSLWLIPSVEVCRGLWTAAYIFTVAVLFVESTRKTKLLRGLYQRVTSEQICGFWGRSFFIWVLPFFQVGYSKILHVHDMPEVDDDLLGQNAGAKLLSAWEEVKSTQGNRRLLRATFRAYLWPYLSGIIPRLALSAFTFCQPFLITATVDFLGSPATAESDKYGQALVGAYVLVYLGLAVSTAVYWRQTYRLNTVIRSGLVTIVYQHSTVLKANDLKDTAAITLMGTDVERIVNEFRSIHEAWASMLEVGVAIWLLERQISVACIVPAIISLVCVLAMGPVSRYSGKAQKQWIERVEKRLAITSSMLGDMKAVKMLGLTNILFSIISKSREIEVKTSERFRKLLIWIIALSNVPMDFAPFATFAVYAIISAVRKDASLLTAQTFTSLSLIALMTGPLLTLCQSMPSLLQALACFDRIEAFCLKKPTLLPGLSTTTISLAESSNNSMELHSLVPSNRPLVSFRNADISWSPESDIVIHNLNLDIQRGITMVIGPVGSGKSALIESILGEASIRNGAITASLSSVAYCAQSPWIMNGTIRHNITGGSEFDQKWYDTTISACALEEDLKNIPGGDMWKAGSKGVSLSGGQKQRVALARAMYSRLQVVILDDVFSGLDSTSVSWISTSLFSKDGYFRQTGRSVILATHTQRMLSYADEILVLDEGKVVDKGTFKEILIRTPEIASNPLILQDVAASSVEETAEKSTKPQTKPCDVVEDGISVDKDNLRRNGTWATYMYYFQSAEYIPMLLLGFVIGLWAFSSNFTTVWLQWWVEANEQQPNQHLGLYLGVYALLFSLSLLGIMAAGWLLFITVINNTALNLHADLLRATLRAPFSFFQKTDTGSITNRFSQDMELIDMTLPLNAINFFAGASACLVKLIILCAVGKYMAASVPFFAVVVFFVQRYYLRTSRQVRLLDIEAKAPLYTHFLETIQGISTIRAFNWEGRFQEQSQNILNQSQRPFYMLFCIQQWLALVLDLVVGAFALILVGMMTSLRDRFSAASIGVALNLILTFNQSLSQSINYWTQLETSIGAVSRVQQFMQDTPSEERQLGSQLPPGSEWPSEGVVRFEDVTACYNAETTPVLKSLSLTVASGEKVAVCGPSGSGKTSLIMALLQMIEIQQGRVTIDGRDLSMIQRSDIRARVNVIPQDPFFVPATVRFNIDPHQRVSEECIESALRKVGLWKRISANGGLDMDLSPSNWSVGERQLLALARALTVRSPILILDEATSSVDFENESIMQDVIEREFDQQTVIAVVHRFRYIGRFDRVVLLNHGDLVECDSPTALLSRDSAFRKLYTALQKAG